MRRFDSRPRRGRSLLWVAVALALLAVAGSVTVVILYNPPSDKTDAKKKDGCRTSDDCPASGVCAAGGCLLLLPSESRNLWEHDLAAQLDPEEPWRPPAFFGEKLLPTKTCPAPSGEVPLPDESHLHHQVKLTVFDLGGERPAVQRQLRTRGSMWFESLRFWLPAGLGDEVSPEDVCVSAGLRAAGTGRGRWRGSEAPYVDVALPQALPVGRETQAAVTVMMDVPPADEQGYRVLSIGLDPVFEGAVERTAVALPLGTNVAAIEGRAPTRQRLLTGYVAYVWEHDGAPGRAAVRYRLPVGLQRRLDKDEVNP